jgi:hypothetical protein
MNEPIRLLQAEIRQDLETIAAAYQQLHVFDERPLDNNTLILVAYHLHVIYGLFENILVRIAANFGNHIEDTSQWHTLLLKRMMLDIAEVRPPVISHEAYHCLDELRRFRHLFRNAYVLHFDPDRLSLIWRDAQKLEQIYLAEFDRFLHFLDSLLTK